MILFFNFVKHDPGKDFGSPFVWVSLQLKRKPQVQNPVIYAKIQDTKPSCFNFFFKNTILINQSKFFWSSISKVIFHICLLYPPFIQKEETICMVKILPAFFPSKKYAGLKITFSFLLLIAPLLYPFSYEKLLYNPSMSTFLAAGRDVD